MSSVSAAGGRSEARTARRERLRHLLGSPSFLIGAAVLLFWLVCALFGPRIAPYDPIFDQSSDISQDPRPRIGSARIAWGATSCHV